MERQSWALGVGGRGACALLGARGGGSGVNGPTLGGTSRYRGTMAILTLHPHVLPRLQGSSDCPRPAGCPVWARGARGWRHTGLARRAPAPGAAQRTDAPPGPPVLAVISALQLRRVPISCVPARAAPELRLYLRQTESGGAFAPAPAPPGLTVQSSFPGFLKGILFSEPFVLHRGPPGAQPGALPELPAPCHPRAVPFPASKGWSSSVPGLE